MSFDNFDLEDRGPRSQTIVELKKMPLLQSDITQIYLDVKTKLDLVEANNKKAKKMLDTMDKLSKGYQPYNVTELSDFLKKGENDESNLLEEVKELLDAAQTSINELRMSNKRSLAEKWQAIYMEQVVRTQKLAKEFETLYNRHIEREAKERVRDSMKRGQILSFDDEGEDDEEINRSIKDIQMNAALTQDQRRTRVEAEVTRYLLNSKKDGLNKVTNLMSGIRDLGFEINKEVEVQGDKLDMAEGQLDEANQFTNKGAQELNIFASTLQGKGIRTLICLVVLFFILIFMVYLIFK